MSSEADSAFLIGDSSEKVSSSPYQQFSSSTSSPSDEPAFDNFVLDESASNGGLVTDGTFLAPTPAARAASIKSAVSSQLPLTAFSLQRDLHDAFSAHEAGGVAEYEMSDLGIAGGMVDGTPVLETDPEVAAHWLSPMASQNRAMMASYFTIGFCSGFYVGPLQYYLAHTIDASPASQAVVTALVALPWSFKIFCGFLSDALPIRGQRRKPYFILGWTIFAACNAILALADKPSVGMVAGFMFLSTLSFILADVCTDAVFVERSKQFERQGSQGKLQSAGYTLRFFGTMIGALFSSFLNEPMWLVFLIQAAMPVVCISPFIASFTDAASSSAPPPISHQLESIWTLVQRRAIWYPSSFVFVYNALALSNPAWNNFLESQLKFTAQEFSFINLASAALSFLSLIVYTRYLEKTSWRRIYVFTTIVMVVFTVLQLVLLFDLISQRSLQFVFSMGDQAIAQFVISIQFLPMVKMFVLMCPEGSEGASYAMLTTMSNLAMSLSSSFSSVASTWWDISKGALNAHDYSGMWKLSLLCAGAQLAGLMLINMLPAGVEEQAQMIAADYSDATAGKVFVLVLSVSLTVVVVSSIVTLAGG